ncbi:hypothetical protein [Streptomyces sp. NPDC001292]|uniref:hypothetical protein n=1 Tax=Streptomyces sp. NPDC001292 TaxID=3364558 RepID=UPI00369F2457
MTHFSARGRPETGSDLGCDKRQDKTSDKPDDKGDDKNSVLGEGFANGVVCVVPAGQ